MYSNMVINNTNEGIALPKQSKNIAEAARNIEIAFIMVFHFCHLLY